jgi:hypothetical protein
MVTNLVGWFLVDENFDEKPLKLAVEEILSENGSMSDLALQTAIRQRYALKIYAVFQPPAIDLNPLVPSSVCRPVERYRFAPLVGPSDIRLFRFKKFVTSGEQVYLSGEIVHANLDEKPVYTAVSYVWGSLTDGIVPALVGDQEFLMVTRNLMELLFRFSGADTPTDTGNTTRLLWTDQLCINQYDSEERGRQVAMMGRIYSEAGETKVWLGEEDEEAKDAFDLVKCFECVDVIDVAPTMYIMVGMSADEIRGKFFAAFPQAIGRIPEKDDPRWKALFKFLERPWFSRLWVFQEAILSSRKVIGSIVCGQMVCSFFHLYLARSLLFVDWPVEILPKGFVMIKYLMDFYVRRNLDSFPPISYTVWQIGSNMRSQDPRDRIYGLLGIQDADEDIHFAVDYKKSVQDVYIDFTRRCIEKSRGLRVLELNKESTEEGVPNLPSWVPDWSIETATVPLESWGWHQGNNLRFKACADFSHIDRQPEVAPSMNLVVRGKVIDHVVAEIEHDFQIGAPIQIEQYLSVNFRVKLWVMFTKDGIDRGLLAKANSETLQAALIRTLIADGYSDHVVATEVPNDTWERLSDDDAIGIYNELENLREISVKGLPLHEGNKAMYRSFWSSTQVCSGRRLAVLQRHWFMLGPSRAKKGDCIAIFHGSTIPWVLRPLGQGSKYEVVGQCFVDGCMHGEAVDWTEDEAETFVLV